VMLAGLVLLAPWEESEPAARATTAAQTPATGDIHPTLGAYKYGAGMTYECDVQRDDDGLLYAGYSRTRTSLLDKNAYRWAVVEAQCLLEHHGASPGVVDGAFGTNTDRAVRQLQTEAKIAVDGVIGPDTWKVLRK
jgi:peptidoglycan hydrolase-like protein with peptidoglycan-binding domain